MNRKQLFSRVAEAQGRQRMIQTKAYGLVCTVTLAGALGMLGIPSAEAAEIKSGLQDTPINRVALDSLSDEQKSQVVAGQITDVPMSWINDETGNVEWITGFTLVYKQKGEVVSVPIEQGTVVPPQNDIAPQKVSRILPKTGTKAGTVLSIAGIGLASFAGWMAFRNKKTRKTLLVSLFVVGGLASSLTTLAAEVDFLSIVDTVSIELSSRFSHTAATHEDWEYVGYIPIIAEESEKVTSTTGNVNIKYVDTDGNEIKGLYNLVVDGVVSTTTTTTTTVDGVTSSKEEVVASGLTYDTTSQKPTLISYKDQYYELVQVKDGDVEQGLVTEGTTTVTYIYKLAPNTTEKTSTPVTGTVKTRYIDAYTGEEIVTGSTIVDNGVVANKVTTTVRNAVGEVVSETTETVPTGLLYNTTLDKAAKDKVIAQMLTSPVEFLNTTTGVTEQIVDNTIVTGTRRYVAYVVKSDLASLSQNLDYQQVAVSLGYDLATEQEELISQETRTVDGIAYNVSRYRYTYTKPITEAAPKVPYVFSRVDGDEYGYVKEGELVITYYYKRAPVSVTPIVVEDILETTQTTVAA